MDKSNIGVYNYSGSFVGAAAKNRDIGFAGMADGVPGMETMTFEEIEYVNAHSNVFRVGRLEFEESERDEVFAALGISGNDALYERDIDELISEWTEENAKRILAISDMDTLERVRGHMMMHRNRADMDIPTRMVTLVDSRFHELTQGRTKSSIVVAKGPEPKRETVSATEVEAMLENQRAELMAQFAAMVKKGVAVSSVGEITERHENVKPVQEDVKIVAEPLKKASNNMAAAKAPAKRGRPTTKKDA